MPDDIVFLDIAEASALLASGDLSPLDLVQAHLDRIEALDGRLSAFLYVNAERALAEAATAHVEFKAGRHRGPLHGIPFGLKDVFDTAGIPTTGNSPAYSNRVPDKDATVVRRLSEAGAILLGKQATHELTYGGVSTELPWPIPRNPWSVDHDTGGSSNGSGAAVASGMSMFALGTDTGGSVRNPAAYCGVVGFKPSFGLVSRSGVMRNSVSFDHCGPLARTVRDIALILDVIAGYDAEDPFSTPGAAGPSYGQNIDSGVKNWKVGILADLYEREFPVGDEARSAMGVALATFAELGAQAETVEISPVDRYARCKALIQKPEIYEEYEGELAKRPGDFGRKFLARISGGKDISAATYLAAQRERRELTAEIDALFDRFDVLVTAGPPGPNLVADVASNWSFDRPEITVPFSLAGVPAISLCIGFTAVGLPLSMQIIGPRSGDRAVLRAAQAYQRATSWHKHHPPL